MSRKKGNIIGLDLGKSVAKFVEYSRSEKQVKTIAILFIELSEWNDESSLAEKIKNWILKYKMTDKKAEVVAAVSAGNAIIKPIELPENESDPLEAIQWEIEQSINSPLTDYFMDYQRVSGEKEGAAYLSAAFRKSEVKKLMRMIDSPELSLSVVDVDIFAVQNAFESNYPEWINQKTILIKADLNNICIVYTHHSQFRKFDSFSVSPELIAAEQEERIKILQSLVDKILTTAFSEFKEDNSPIEPDRVLYCGDLAVDVDFASLLEKNIKQPIEKLNPFKEVVFPHEVEYSNKVVGSAPQCAAALGLALRYSGDSK